MEPEPNPLLSTYANMWLTLVSGVIILKYGRELVAGISRRMAPVWAPVRTRLAHVAAWVDHRRPPWTDHYAIVPIVLIFMGLPYANIQLFVRGGLGLELVVIAQVSIALGLVGGRAMASIAIRANKRIRQRPTEPVAQMIALVVGLAFLTGAGVLAQMYLDYLFPS